jgi:hypothetical protein
MKLTLILFLIGAPIIALSQSTLRLLPLEENNDSSVYTGMYKILNGLQPINYGGFPIYCPVNRLPIGLLDGEGKNDYLLGANLDQAFTLLQGRSGSRGFYQKSRLSFRYATSFRLTNDSSAPLTPSNQKFGFDYSIALWNNYTQSKNLKGNRSYYDEDTSWITSTTDFKVVHLIINAMHYSNGQPPNSFLSSVPYVRNNYRTGDFSTNYLKVMAVYSKYTKKHSLQSLGLGFRRDGNFVGALGFLDSQKKRYGQNRIEGLAQFITAPRATKRIRNWRNPANQQWVQYTSYYSLRFRTELDYIVGNLNDFKIVGIRDKAYRFSGHAYVEFMMGKFRTMGFIVHAFYGRDFLNIRYDDIVFGGDIGVSFNLNKYRAPRLNTNVFITSHKNTRMPVNNKLKNKHKFRY